MECQKHDDYQESIRWLLNFIGEYAQHGRTTAEAGVGQTSIAGVTKVVAHSYIKYSFS